ncbi:hypothetical protein LXL04_019812 [Taraxacum kok-saghyz]
MLACFTGLPSTSELSVTDRDSRRYRDTLPYVGTIKHTREFSRQFSPEIAGVLWKYRIQSTSSLLLPSNPSAARHRERYEGDRRAPGRSRRPSPPVSPPPPPFKIPLPVSQFFKKRETQNPDSLLSLSSTSVLFSEPPLRSLLPTFPRRRCFQASLAKLNRYSRSRIGQGHKRQGLNRYSRSRIGGRNIEHFVNCKLVLKLYFMSSSASTVTQVLIQITRI